MTATGHRRLRSWLPYLVWLGVDALWIDPDYPSGGADGGHDIVDYQAVDPDYGVAGFRVDVAYGLIKDAELRDNPGAYSPTLFGHGPEQAMTWNQPEVHDFWRRWRVICDEYPDTMLVGEVCLADLDQVALSPATTSCTSRSPSGC